MYDLTKWFMMPLSSDGLKYNYNGQLVTYGRDTHHLEGLNVTNNTKVYAYHNDTGKSMWFTKTPQRFPWDVKAYDANNIYSTVTEADIKGWSDPHNYKSEGWVMFPRYWDGDPSSYAFHPNAVWKNYQGCVLQSQGDVGPILYTIEGPFSMDFGGDIGITQTILITYYWSDRTHREQLFLTNTAGWVTWTHAKFTLLSLNTSMYVIDAKVIHNKIIPGTIVPNFACYVIP